MDIDSTISEIFPNKEMSGIFFIEMYNVNQKDGQK